MHKARFTGDRLYLHYTNHGRSYDTEPLIYSYYRPVPYNPWEDNHLIYEGQLDDPPLVKGQTIYLHELKQSVEVEKVLRSTDGTYTYETTYEIEKFENEETMKSKEYAEMVLRDWKERYEPVPRGDIPGQRKSWWERLFG